MASKKKAYANAVEHLDDYLERVRLLLLRSVARYWYRTSDSKGRIDDLFVSFEEVRQALIRGYGLLRPPASLARARSRRSPRARSRYTDQVLLVQHL